MAIDLAALVAAPFVIMGVYNACQDRGGHRQASRPDPPGRPRPGTGSGAGPLLAKVAPSTTRAVQTEGNYGGRPDRRPLLLQPLLSGTGSSPTSSSSPTARSASGSPWPARILPLGPDPRGAGPEGHPGRKSSCRGRYPVQPLRRVEFSLYRPRDRPRRLPGGRDPRSPASSPKDPNQCSWSARASAASSRRRSTRARTT